MNQKPVNFSKKYRRSRMRDGQPANCNRKPTLFSIDDSNQMAVECSRARLMQQLTKPDKELSRDFAAYFHSSTNNKDPKYAAISHHTRDLPRRLVIPTYPCTQSLRWNPYVETSAIDEELNTPACRPDPRYERRSDPTPDMSFGRQEEPKFNCRCDSCAMQKCPSKTPLNRPVFKDNIMTFCDRNTMTPRVNEIGCGCTPVPSARVSDVSVTASDIAVKDTQARMRLHHFYSPENCSGSILKRNQLQEEYPNYSQSHRCEHVYDPSGNFLQEPERDMCDDYVEPSRMSSIKSFFRCKKKKSFTSPRRMIYNEGISDMVTNNYPVTPLSIPPPTNMRKECKPLNLAGSSVSVRSKCCLNEGIPFSHRTDSRYHYHCKSSNSRSFYGDVDEVRHVVASPETVRKPCPLRPAKFPKLPYVKMPKKVLTSERDIEAYIDRGFPRILIPATRRPKN